MRIEGREFQAADRARVRHLADRRTEGVAPWRDAHAVRRAVRTLIGESSSFDFDVTVFGAANQQALRFYRQLGYRDEDVELAKVLNG